MRIGLDLLHFRPSTPETMRFWFKETAQAAEENGFSSVWLMDHFFQLGGWMGEPEDRMVEGYTTLGYLAGVTEKLTLGLMVGGVIYRHPALVIKTISTLDVISGGRAYFGIGAAWNEHETKSLGMRFPSMKERFEQLEDILRLAHHMWSGDTSAFEGTHLQAPYPVNNPQPLQKPHPPILIGGSGEKKTLRFVAQYADACNLSGRSSLEELQHKLDVLKGHCDDVGRPYEEIEKTIGRLVNLDKESAADLVEAGKSYAQMGFQHLIFSLRGDYTPETIRMFGEEVIPELREL